MNYTLSRTVDGLLRMAWITLPDGPVATPATSAQC